MPTNQHWSRHHQSTEVPMPRECDVIQDKRNSLHVDGLDRGTTIRILMEEVGRRNGDIALFDERAPASKRLPRRVMAEKLTTCRPGVNAVAEP